MLPNELNHIHHIYLYIIKIESSLQATRHRCLAFHLTAILMTIEIVKLPKRTVDTINIGIYSHELT